MKDTNDSKKPKEKVQCTKLITGIILAVGFLFIQESYILAFLGKEQIADGLSQTVATVIIGTVLGYLIKSYSETKQIKKNELIERQMDLFVPYSDASEAEEMDESGDSYDAESEGYEYPDEN